ncbi:UbiA family prenyltransferase [Gryllotalpicola reticulitermitis]|uniref:UbiA family prenyltransferase n=1 Tax=Gryllotalpicola reticulitermitis TaxID=1184153 RepID=A0ABV8Q7D3_9MICO
MVDIEGTPVIGAQVLCVDLDETLIRSDLLWEATVRFLAGNPLRVIAVIAMVLRGPARLKSWLAARVSLEAELLPYNQAVVALVTAARADGAHTVLATASPEPYARQVADALGIFDEVIATEGGVNLSGRAKAQALIERFGERGFTYAGNSQRDLNVWRHAGRAISVDASAAVQSGIATMGIESENLRTPRPSWRVWLRQVRLHQSVKNALVFVPLLASLRERSWADAGESVLAFVAFTLLTSVVYIWNDLSDLDSDRAHATKRYRPLASGTIGIPQALVVCVLCGAGAFVTALFLNPLVAAILALYLVTTSCYSAFVKRIAVADVIVLAALYIIRVLAGCAALLIVPSVWLLLYCVFIFFSLALMKRCAELGRRVDTARSGRGYLPKDRGVLTSLGITSGVASILVFGLYINSLAADRLYDAPVLLWLAVPVLLYWIARAWMLTDRGSMHDDPVVFALRDPASVITAGVLAAIAAAAVVVPL